MKPIAALAVLALNLAAQTPSGWQIMKDKKQACQLAAPPGWTADKIMPSMVTSPDKKANVIFSSKPDGVTYSDIAKMAKDMFKPAKIFEESASRTFFASAPQGGKNSWYIVLKTNPVCEAQVEFRDPAFEADAKQMMNSLKSTK